MYNSVLLSKILKIVVSLEQNFEKAYFYLLYKIVFLYNNRHRQIPRGKNGTTILNILDSLGTNSSMIANCSVLCDVRHIRSSVLGQNVMFGSVRSSVLLLCDPTMLRTYSLMFANCLVFVMFDMFDVRFWAKM